MDIISIQNLNHHFSKTNQVLYDLSINVPEGCIYGFLGPNGAGKTTTLRLLMSLIKPQSGSVVIFGKDMSSHRMETLKQIGSLIEMPSLYLHLTAKENLKIYQHIYGVEDSRIDEILEIVDLKDVGKKKVKGFSLGMKQRLSIAVALLHKPRLLILDEPTNGLDPNGIIDMRNLLRKINKEDGITIVISSHLLAEIEKIATHIGIINRGKMIFEGTLLDLQNLKSRQTLLNFETSDDQRAKMILAETNEGLEIKNNLLSMPFLSRETTAENLKKLIENGISVYSCKSESTDLEDIFLNMTSIN